MHRHHTMYLISVGLSFAIVALILWNRPCPPPAAHAAASTTQPIYLPLILKGGCNSLIRDGGFEASTNGTTNPYWQVTSNIPRSIFDNSLIPMPNPTHSGIWKAWLGGDNLLQQTLTQTVTIPASASSLQVSVWWLVNTTESTPSGQDHVYVQILNASGVVQETLYHLYDIDWGTVWAQKTVTATQTYANQQIQLAFVASTDSVNPTSFFIDDVALQACQ